jgi:uncharacterized protein (TIGR03067 family)
VLVVGQARADDKEDKEKLQGEWVSLKRESAGKSQILTRDSPLYHKFNFEGDKVTCTAFSPDPGGTFAIDSSKKPKTIDYTTATGFLMEGIYELNGDTLKLCFGNPNERPTEFKSKGNKRPTESEFKSKGEVVYTYKQVKN